MPVIIKHYQNRKLYNTRTKRYITLKGIEELIKQEQEITVIDNQTGEDITAVTLSQIIYEMEKNRSDFLPLKILLALVQSGGNRIDEIKRNIFTSLSLFHHYDVEIEKRVNMLIDRGELTREAGTQILGKLLAVNYQRYEAREELEGDIYKFLRERQILTKRDLYNLSQKIEKLSQRVDAFNLDGIENEVTGVKNQINE